MELLELYPLFATQINSSKDNFYLFQNNTNKDYNANIYK